MNYRALGKTGFKISEVSLGTWQLGGCWGSAFDMDTAEKTLKKAVDLGVNFFDTADCYNNGLSEKAIGKFLKSAGERILLQRMITGLSIGMGNILIKVKHFPGSILKSE